MKFYSSFVALLATTAVANADDNPTEEDFNRMNLQDYEKGPCDNCIDRSIHPENYEAFSRYSSYDQLYTGKDEANKVCPSTKKLRFTPASNTDPATIFALFHNNLFELATCEGEAALKEPLIVDPTTHIITPVAVNRERRGHKGEQRYADRRQAGVTCKGAGTITTCYYTYKTKQENADGTRVWQQIALWHQNKPWHAYTTTEEAATVCPSADSLKYTVFDPTHGIVTATHGESLFQLAYVDGNYGYTPQNLTSKHMIGGAVPSNNWRETYRYADRVITDTKSGPAIRTRCYYAYNATLFRQTISHTIAVDHYKHLDSHPDQTCTV